MPCILCAFEFRVLGDQFLQSMVHEADGEFSVVAFAFCTKDRSVTVLRMLYARPEHPLSATAFLSCGSGGPGRRRRWCNAALTAAENLHDGVHGVVGRTA